MGDNDLTLEKMEVRKSLEEVKEHMKKGEENRQTLMTGFAEVKESVKKMEDTLFGSDSKVGVVHQMQEMIKVADGIKWVLTKIFVAIITAVSLSMLPSVFTFLSKVTHK